MTNLFNDCAILVLSDGTLLEGKPFGLRGTVYGEIVFNTGITGYQEVLTDPSYHGQLVTFTYPELGNTGVNPNDPTGAGGGNIGTGQVPLPNEQGFSGNEQGLNEPPQATGERPPTLAGLQ